jgi:hypothetical protein
MKKIELIIFPIFFLIIGCEKENDPEIKYLVKYVINLTVSNSTDKKFYEYDKFGRVTQIDKNTFYTYSDSIIDEVYYGESHDYDFHTKYYINSKGLAYKSVGFYVDQPTDTNSFYINYYYYDSIGHLTKESIYRGFLHEYNYNYVWEYDNIKEEIHEILYENSTFSEKLEYLYYDEKLNNRGFGFDIFGRKTYNLIREIKNTETNHYWEKYYYEFDSHLRPIKETKITMSYSPIYSHYGDIRYDSVSDNLITGYIYY